MNRERLYELFFFDLEAGTITRRKSGCQVTSKNKDGYIQTKVDGKLLYAHRILFFIANGYLPKLVDHINEDKADNSPVNLRELTHRQNLLNRRQPKGAYFNKDRGKWIAQISNTYLGCFDTEAEALAVRKKAVTEAFNLPTP
jgi:hypothetical protein